MRTSTPSFFIFLLVFFNHAGFTQTIGTFNSVQPTAQTQNLVLPATHSFQRIIRSGNTLSSGETVGNSLDFTGYVPVGGSSTNGYLSISHETSPAGCTILSVSLQPTVKLWTVNSGGNVVFPFSDIGAVRTFCAGTVTPSNHIMVCEETAADGDGNGDGYADDGWIIEIDPITRTVINQDGTGGVDKLWAMGRQKHEDIAIKSDQTVAYLSADNLADGYVYKFVPTVAGNFSSGSLYVLQTTAALGTGTWKLISNSTIADRNNTISLSQAAGAYNFSRVEGIEIGPDGKIYFPSTVTGNIYRFRDLGATVDNLEVFVSSTAYDVDGAGPFAAEPWGVGHDNLAFDGEGNLWVLQDGDRNHIWVVGPTHTATNPDVRLFATTPAGCEPTGITFSPDYKYLFLSIQHPDANTTAQIDAAGTAVVFDQSTAIVIARKENLGSAVLPLANAVFTLTKRGQEIELNGDFEGGMDHILVDIERSVDGGSFQAIGKEIIQGTKLHYTDKKVPVTNIVFYRLKWKDSQGEYHYSATKSLLISPAKELQFYYDLSSKKIKLVYASSSTGQLNFSVFNTAGALMSKERKNITAGNTSIELDVHSLVPGNYFLTVEDGTAISIHPFIKF